MKKIGMIGGLSWVASAEYYRRLNQITQQTVGGIASARIVLESINRQDYIAAMVDRKDEKAACRQILNAAYNLQAAKADFIVIACNNAHRFVPEIQPLINIPILHIADITAAAIKAQGMHKVAILGVRETMEGDFYQASLAQYGLKTVPLEDAEKSFIHDSIHSELVQNDFRQTTRQRYQQIITALGGRGADCVALACTEIPLLLSSDASPLPAFSTTELHCQAAVAQALE
jgi:aspartate racemase